MRAVKPEAIDRYLTRQGFRLIGGDAGNVKEYEDEDGNTLTVPQAIGSNWYPNAVFAIAEYFATDGRQTEDIIRAMRHS